MNRRRRSNWFWNGLKIFIWVLVFIALGPSLISLPRAWLACRVWEEPQALEPPPDDAAIREAVGKVPDYYRPESKTYLTIPEWYIVYSTDEYAAFLQDHRPSGFPYFQAVAQYWQSYVNACNAIKGRYSFNGDSQFTLAFMGISFTADNMLKGTYEWTIGRLTEWISSDTPTEEEVYAAQVAKEYGEFLHTTPWYFFPFGEKLQGLWSGTSRSGPDPIRKWERKIALTVEYGSKAIYAGITNLGARAAYGGADVEKIYAVTTGVTDDMLSSDLEIVERIGDRQLIRITRFEYFSDTVPGLVERGVQFVEIAGNDDIVLTVIGPQGDPSRYTFEHGLALFDLPILTHPSTGSGQVGLTRVAVKVRVADIGPFLQELKSKPDIKFEHLYDY